jgi:hypothetical protein
MVVGAPRIPYHIGAAMEGDRGYDDILRKDLVDDSPGNGVEALCALSVVREVPIDVHGVADLSTVTRLGIGGKSLTAVIDSLLPLFMVVADSVRHWCDYDLPGLKEMRHLGVHLVVAQEILQQVVRCLGSNYLISMEGP